MPTADRERPEGTDPIEWMVARVRRDQGDAPSAAELLKQVHELTAALGYREAQASSTAELLKQIHELTTSLRYWEAQAPSAAELLKQVHELTAALRYWEAQAAALLEHSNAATKIRYVGRRVTHATKRRMGNVVRWLRRVDTRTAK